jgi:hypothetical protein
MMEAYTFRNVVFETPYNDEQYPNTHHIYDDTPPTETYKKVSCWIPLENLYYASKR